MNQIDPLNDVAHALAVDWELALPYLLSEEVILNLLEEKIGRLISTSPEAFFNLMYRLDISEHHLQTALEDQGNNIRLVAKLIYDRQLQKIKTKAAFRNHTNPEQDLDLRW